LFCYSLKCSFNCCWVFVLPSPPPHDLRLCSWPNVLKNTELFWPLFPSDESDTEQFSEWPLEPAELKRYNMRLGFQVSADRTGGTSIFIRKPERGALAQSQKAPGSGTGFKSSRPSCAMQLRKWLNLTAHDQKFPQSNYPTPEFVQPWLSSNIAHLRLEAPPVDLTSLLSLLRLLRPCFDHLAVLAVNRIVYDCSSG
jgi:hypothetical protein